MSLYSVNYVKAKFALLQVFLEFEVGIATNR